MPEYKSENEHRLEICETGRWLHQKGFVAASDAMYGGTANIVTNTPPESGATAAIERLSKSKAEAKPAYKAYDADANALGKTRCVMFNAAVMSPAIAGMPFGTMEQYLTLVKQAADAGVAYSFQK